MSKYYKIMTKYLIINAEDFGMSKVFNDAILDLIKKNLISSTTVMVDRVIDNQNEQFDELISLSKSMNLSVGLHLEFKSKDYSSQITSQFQKFKLFLGFVPSHLDIHRSRDVRDSFSCVAEFCREINVPFRNRGEEFDGVKSTSKEAFFGTVDDFRKIADWIKILEDGKYYEILFHPGTYDPDCKSSLNKDREGDIEHIKKLNDILNENNIKLISFLDLATSP